MFWILALFLRKSTGGMLIQIHRQSKIIRQNTEHLLIYIKICYYENKNQMDKTDHYAAFIHRHNQYAVLFSPAGKIRRPPCWLSWRWKQQQWRVRRKKRSVIILTVTMKKTTYNIILSAIALILFFIATGCRSQKHYEAKYMAAASIDFKNKIKKTDKRSESKTIWAKNLQGQVSNKDWD